MAKCQSTVEEGAGSSDTWPDESGHRSPRLLESDLPSARLRQAGGPIRIGPEIGPATRDRTCLNLSGCSPATETDLSPSRSPHLSPLWPR